MDFIKWIFVKIFPWLSMYFGMIIAGILRIESGRWLFAILGFGVGFYFYDEATTQWSPAYSDEKYDEITESEEKRVKKETNRIFIMSIIMILFIITVTVLQAYWPKYKKYNWTCWDVTSIDWNWQNDFKCVSDDGEVKWMDKKGMLKFLDID